jgi:two-component system cell cycle response regulator
VINNEKLKHIGLTDPLTGVNNRRYVERRLLEELGRSRRQGYALSCMYIDIDHFKKINDSRGHQAGDEVLREVAARIKAELRLSDALGRFGGEEFVVLLIDAELTDAVCVAERIRQSVAEQPLLSSGGAGVTVTVSIGVAALRLPDGGDALETAAQDLLARADQALYRAKGEGRNRVNGN